jgi:hypothetical protein
VLSIRPTVGQTARTWPSIRTPKDTDSSHLVHPKSETGVSLLNADSVLSFLQVTDLLVPFRPSKNEDLPGVVIASTALGTFRLE